MKTPSNYQNISSVYECTGTYFLNGCPLPPPGGGAKRKQHLSRYSIVGNKGIDKGIDKGIGGNVKIFPIIKIAGFYVQFNESIVETYARVAGVGI
jgi:hypothetical protein